MGRKSLKEERSAMILDAFERCVSQYGLDGSSLERIAEEAGVKRSIIRHYLGNREDLILALTERVLLKYRKMTEDMLTLLTGKDCLQTLLDILFPDVSQTTSQDIMIMESLIMASERDERVRGLMRDWMEEYVKQFASVIQQAHPQASKEKALTIAYGIIGIYHNHDSLLPLKLAPEYRTRARQSAELLFEGLKA